MVQDGRRLVNPTNRWRLGSVRGLCAFQALARNQLESKQSQDMGDPSLPLTRVIVYSVVGQPVR